MVSSTTDGATPTTATPSLANNALVTNYSSLTSYFNGDLRCQKCGLIFFSRYSLVFHEEQEGHIVCDSCDRCFHSKEALFNHQIKDHRAEQDLTCPGCVVTFTTAASWVQHVETNKCPGVLPSELSSHAPEILSYLTKALQKKGHFDLDWSALPGRGAAHPSDVWGPDWNKASHQEQAKKLPPTSKQVVHRGGSDRSHPSTRNDTVDLKQHLNNAGVQKKNLFPEKSQPAVQPSTSLVKDVARPVPSGPPSGERIIDPDHPGFNPALFKDPILGTYKCPHKGCHSKFKGPGGLVGHLRSPTHSSDTRLRCPGCHTFFNSTSAWIAHAETVSKSRCRIRTEEFYGHALYLTTNGALDVDDSKKLANDTVKLKFDETWLAKKLGKSDSTQQSETPGFEGESNSQNIIW